MAAKQLKTTLRKGDTYVVDSERYSKMALAVHKSKTLIDNLFELCYVSEKCLNYCTANNKHLKTVYTTVYCSTLSLINKSGLKGGYTKYKAEQDEAEAKSDTKRDWAYYDRRLGEITER